MDAHGYLPFDSRLFRSLDHYGQKMVLGDLSLKFNPQISSFVAEFSWKKNSSTNFHEFGHKSAGPGNLCRNFGIPAP
jgi:hypothetical protein